jgi:hypothetical protein
MELIGQFLVGNGRPQPILVHVPQRREIDLAVEVPASELPMRCGKRSTRALPASWNKIARR